MCCPRDPAIEVMARPILSVGAGPGLVTSTPSVGVGWTDQAALDATARVGSGDAPNAQELVRPDQLRDNHHDDPDDYGQRGPDADEVGELIAAGPVDQ